MDQHDPDWINHLIGRFTDLQELWENDPDTFDWPALQALAEEGAAAYNEGAGPSFHALALDGVPHSAFHERFLASSLQAGFDPFKLAPTGTGMEELPVIEHASLAQDALSNPSSARMRASLMEVARRRFAPLLQQIDDGKPDRTSPLMRAAEVCADSIPVDMLQRIAPELVREHHGETREQNVDPVEGYLTAAEFIVDKSSQPYG